MKTPLQTAIEQIEEYKPIAGTDPFPYILHKLKSLLPSEREAIEDAYDEGWTKGNNKNYDNAEKYFTTKYNDNE